MRHPLLLAAAAALVAAGCGSDTDVSSTRAAQYTESSASDAPIEPSTGSSTGSSVGDPVIAPVGEIEWTPVEGGEGIEEGLLEVPVDYDDPDGETFELYVVRRLADDPDQRIGSLLVNPGGPGFGGSEYAEFADQIYGEDLLDRFDIVGWDPRGTGLSEPAIDCIDDYDRFYGAFDITPDDEAEREQIADLAEEYAAACVERSGAILPGVGTNNSARDIDRIRQALGEDEISFFGFSYGSELGATWATLFPDTVRAAVFDGATDPTAALNEGFLLQIEGFENTLATFLAECSADTSCAFHNDGDAEAAFDTLMEDLDENPVPSSAGRPDVNRTIAIGAVVQAMYGTAYWDQLEQALADAEDGDGAGLLDLWDSYYQRGFDGTWGNELEAFQSISCMDTDERPTVAEEDEFAAELTEVAPRLAPEGSIGSYFCTFFPPSADPRVDLTAAGAPPILVVGTTGDPATPLKGARVMADTLENGVLLVVDADEHTGYSVNDCSRSTIERYLTDLEVPVDESEC
jgi:pimeloyl-ACP methyl ester carboxylesterase